METEEDMDEFVNRNKTSTQITAEPHTPRPPSPVPSGVSIKSDESLPLPSDFSSEPEPSELEPPSPLPSCVSRRRNSLSKPCNFSCEPEPSGLETHQDLLRYACKLTLDPNTAHRNLSLSEGNRKVTCVYEEQPYPDHPERFDSWPQLLCREGQQEDPDHPERFDSWPQVLCREGLSGRCYWEAEWSGDWAHIAVAYKSIKRKGRSDDVIMGCNAKSWSLSCSSHSYSAWHNNKDTDIPVPSSGSRRVGVYLDWPAGTLSFYSVSSDTLTHLHTFHSTFTEPLYPGFWVWDDSSVSLCQIT